jgi:hypothetical protein
MRILPEKQDFERFAVQIAWIPLADHLRTEATASVRGKKSA